MERIIQIETLLRTYSWFKGMLENPNMDKEMIKETVNGVIELWTRQLEQEYLTKNLSKEPERDYEIEQDFWEQYIED